MHLIWRLMVLDQVVSLIHPQQCVSHHHPPLLLLQEGQQEEERQWKIEGGSLIMVGLIFLPGIELKNNIIIKNLVLGCSSFGRKY